MNRHYRATSLSAGVLILMLAAAILTAVVLVTISLFGAEAATSI